MVDYYALVLDTKPVKNKFALLDGKILRKIKLELKEKGDFTKKNQHVEWKTSPGGFEN